MMVWVECPNCNKVKRTYSKNFRCCAEQYICEEHIINHADYMAGLKEEKEVNDIQKKKELNKQPVKPSEPLGGTDSPPLIPEGSDLIKEDDDKLTKEEQDELKQLKAEKKKIADKPDEENTCGECSTVIIGKPKHCNECGVALAWEQ